MLLVLVWSLEGSAQELKPDVVKWKAFFRDRSQKLGIKSLKSVEGDILGSTVKDMNSWLSLPAAADMEISGNVK